MKKLGYLITDSTLAIMVFKNYSNKKKESKTMSSKQKLPQI